MVALLLTFKLVEAKLNPSSYVPVKHDFHVPTGNLFYLSVTFSFFHLLLSFITLKHSYTNVSSDRNSK